MVDLYPNPLSFKRSSLHWRSTWTAALLLVIQTPLSTEKTTGTSFHEMCCYVCAKPKAASIITTKRRDCNIAYMQRGSLGAKYERFRNRASRFLTVWDVSTPRLQGPYSAGSKAPRSLPAAKYKMRSFAHKFRSLFPRRPPCDLRSGSLAYQSSCIFEMCPRSVLDLRLRGWTIELIRTYNSLLFERPFILLRKSRDYNETLFGESLCALYTLLPIYLLIHQVEKV